MAKLIEAESNGFFLKCKGVAVILAAVSGLTLGVLNWFKEVRDPRVKISYQETAKQVEALSSDVRRLADAVRQQAEEISTIQNWILYTQARRPMASPAEAKILGSSKFRVTVKVPPMRKPASWDGLRQQTVKGD